MISGREFSNRVPKLIREAGVLEAGEERRGWGCFVAEARNHQSKSRGEVLLYQGVLV